MNYKDAIKFRSTVSLKEKDNGYRALMKRLDEVKRGEVFVGITEESGVHLNPRNKQQISVLEVATINEFGLGVPERSFVRQWQAAYESTAKDLEKREWAKVLMGEQTASAALHKLGKTFLLACRANFLSFPFTPNAPATVQRKGFNKPLIETGQLYSSLTYRIKLGSQTTSDQTYAIQFKD